MVKTDLVIRSHSNEQHIALNSHHNKKRIDSFIIINVSGSKILQLEVIAGFVLFINFFFSFTGIYACLKVNLLFKREFSYYLIQIYIPCCMLVIVSWVSFWLDANAVPARVSLGVTTLLTMATQTTGINNSLPPVSYTKVTNKSTK